MIATQFGYASEKIGITAIKRRGLMKCKTVGLPAGRYPKRKRRRVNKELHEVARQGARPQPSKRMERAKQVELSYLRC